MAVEDLAKGRRGRQRVARVPEGAAVAEVWMI